jgi:geranylgeranyl reductase family protein
MEAFDAIIVGGGPAGSTCARTLVREGMRVALLDRKAFPRDKVCAGWITPEVVSTLQLNPADYETARVLQPIHSFRTGLIGGTALTTRYDEVVSYGIRRCEFDDYLLKRAGAHLELGEPLTTLHRKGGIWEINDRMRAPLLIGAGGHYCPIARHLGADLGRGESPVTAQEIEFELSDAQRDTCALEAKRPELYFCDDLRGYGWCFRKGNWVNIGLGREGTQSLAPHVSAFLRFLQQAGRIPLDLPGRLHGHAYLLYRNPAPRPRLADGVLLVGDAAGLAYPQSGEGIRPAVESALLASQTVIEAKGDYRAAQLQPYAERLHLRLGPGEPSTAPGPMKRLAGRLLLGNRLLTRHIVLDRWFLHRGQPAMSG